VHLKTQISRELDRLELLIDQIRSVEAEQEAVLAAESKAAPEAGFRSREGGVRGRTAQRGGDVADREGDRRSLRRYSLVGRTVSTVLQSPPGRSLCRSGGDALAKRRGYARAGLVESRQSATAYLDGPARLALAAPSARIGAGPLVHARGERGRKGSIVALARKLLIALWKYVTQGVVIEGAAMKAAT